MIAGVRVRAVVEEKGREIEMEIDDGFDQGRRAIGIGKVDVGFGIEQRAGGIEIVLARGEEKRGEAAAWIVHRHAALLRHERGVIEHAGAGVDIGAVRDQQLNHGRMLFRRGPHERCLAAPVLLRVDVRAVIEQ